MHERFTDRARKVMQLANQEAQRFNHEYIGTEHILLGLIGEGAGVAANLLKGQGIDLAKIRWWVEQIVQPCPGGNDVVMSRLPRTPQVRKAIDYAAEEASNLKHDCIGTQHLLLGLLRAQENVAAQILLNLRVSIKALRKALAKMRPPGDRMADFPESLPVTPNPFPNHLPEARVEAIQDLLEEVLEKKEAAIFRQDFEQAIRCRTGVAILNRILATEGK